MHILALALMFLVGAVMAAFDGDYSGIAAIGKFVGFVFLMIALMWLFLHPAALILVVAVFGFIVWLVKD